jgi:hypothetical protein
MLNINAKILHVLSADDESPEVISPNTDDTGLHSFTKLAIAYIGILLGLTVISVILGGVIMFSNRAPLPSNPFGSYLTVYYAVLIPLMLATIEFLRRGKKLGAYLAYASMAIHYSIYYPTILFAVTSGVVGILLWRSIRYLK